MAQKRLDVIGAFPIFFMPDLKGLKFLNPLYANIVCLACSSCLWRSGTIAWTRAKTKQPGSPVVGNPGRMLHGRSLSDPKCLFNCFFVSAGTPQRRGKSAGRLPSRESIPK